MYKLLELIKSKPPKNEAFYLLAIDGRGGSGKSTLVTYVRQILPSYIVLSGDDYFEPIENQAAWGRFNVQRFINDVIEPLKISSTFVYRPYNWHVEPHISEKTIEVTDGLCLERGYSFLFDLDWDLKMWVETPKEVCFELGVSRETLPKTRAEKAWEQWQSDEDDYIRDYQPAVKADIILKGTAPFTSQLD